jgi:ABC-type uncharacterized transport system permease subunit
LDVAAAIGGNPTVWIRGGIVSAIAVTTIAPVAVAVIVALPHDGFPARMKAEQVVVGLLLAAAAVALYRGAVRRAYRKAERAR